MSRPELRAEFHKDTRACQFWKCQFDRGTGKGKTFQHGSVSGTAVTAKDAGEVKQIMQDATLRLEDFPLEYDDTFTAYTDATFYESKMCSYRHSSVG